MRIAHDDRWCRGSWVKWGEAIWRLIKFASITLLPFLAPPVQQNPWNEQTWVCKSACSHSGCWMCRYSRRGWRRWQEFTHRKSLWQSGSVAPMQGLLPKLWGKTEEWVFVLVLQTLELPRVVKAGQAGASALGCGGRPQWSHVWQRTHSALPVLCGSYTVAQLQCHFLHFHCFGDFKIQTHGDWKNSTFNSDGNKESKLNVFLKSLVSHHGLSVYCWSRDCAGRWPRNSCAVLRHDIISMVTSVAGMYAIADSLEDENIPNQ